METSEHVEKRARPNRHPFLQSFALALGLFALAVLVAVLTVGINSFQAGQLLAGCVVLPGLIVGFIARSQQSRWPLWKYALCVLAVAAVTTVLALR